MRCLILFLAFFVLSPMFILTSQTAESNQEFTYYPFIKFKIIVEKHRDDILNTEGVDFMTKYTGWLMELRSLKSEGKALPVSFNPDILTMNPYSFYKDKSFNLSDLSKSNKLNFKSKNSLHGFFPEGSSQLPQTPEGSSQTPKRSSRTPEGSSQTPEGSQLPQTPEGSSQTPEGSR